MIPNILIAPVNANILTGSVSPIIIIAPFILAPSITNTPPNTAAPRSIFPASFPNAFKPPANPVKNPFIPPPFFASAPPASPARLFVLSAAGPIILSFKPPAPPLNPPVKLSLRPPKADFNPPPLNKLVIPVRAFAPNWYIDPKAFPTPDTATPKKLAATTARSIAFPIGFPTTIAISFATGVITYINASTKLTTTSKTGANASANFCIPTCIFS